MFIDRAWRVPASEGLDGAISVILLRLLHEARVHVEHDTCAARACLDRASALIEGERSRAEHDDADPALAAGRQRLAAWQVQRVRTCVNDHLAGPIRVQELAGIARLEASAFCKAFRATFGMAVQDYVSMRRMNLACILMLTTDQPLSQVAQACGVPCLAAFTQEFSRVFGSKPEAWRLARRGFVARP